jgi:hypothetical protein
MPWRQHVARWRLLPLDPYTALGLAPQASAQQVQQAYEDTLRWASASRWHRVWAQVCGQSPARLEDMREELLDPVRRNALDQHLATLRKRLEHPPQT